jgi:hypothetical protein
MKHMLLILMTLFLSSGAWAQATCEDIFHITGLELDSGDFTMEKQADPAQLNALTLTILKMTSFSRSSVFTEKHVVEKGELVLATPLNDGWSVEFEYAADLRGTNPIYRLKEIDLIKPNGESSTLDKAPTNTAGDAFRKAFYPTESVNEALKDANLKMPAAIYSAVFQNINRWAMKAEFIKRNELQGLSTIQDLKKLNGKVAFRSTIDYTNKVIKKQSFKFILLGMAMYFYSQREVITNEVIKVDPWDKMKRMSEVALTTDYMRDRMSTQLSLMLKRPIKVNQDPAFTDELDYPKVANVLESLELLNRFERQYGSKPVMAYFSKNELSALSFKKLNLALIDALSEDDSAAIIVYFPHTRRIVLISSEWMSFNQYSDFVLPFVMDPSLGKNSGLFEELELKLIYLKQKKD